MPGLDKSRFINWSESDDELLCGLCLSVLDNPLFTPCCRQTYCRDCVTQWLRTSKTCPNDRKPLTLAYLLLLPRPFINILHKLKIKCDFQSNGCNDEVLYGRYKSHTRDCKYSPEAICGDCGTKNGQRSEHNCVQLLLTKNRELETMNKQLSEQNLKLEMEIINTKISKDETIQKLELEKNNILKENFESKQTIENFNAAVKKANNLNELLFSQKLSELKKGVVVKLENEIEEKVCETKRFHKSFQVIVKYIDIFFDRQQTVYGHVINEYGFEWKLKVNKKIIANQSKYLGLHLECDRNSSNTKISPIFSVEFSIIRQYNNGKTSKSVLKKCYFDANGSRNECGFDDFIDAKYIFEASNHYIKDNSIILDVTVMSED